MKLPPTGITVVIRDISPYIHLREPVSYRRVTIDLTPEQAEALRLRHQDEEYSISIIEPAAGI